MRKKARSADSAWVEAFLSLLSIHFPTLAEMERLLLLSALSQNDWSQKDAARVLGITPRMMTYKLKQAREVWKEKLRGSELDFPKPAAEAADEG